MPTTRRELFKSSLATAAALASAPFAHAVAPRPAWPPHYIATPAQVVANMAKLNQNQVMLLAHSSGMVKNILNRSIFLLRTLFKMHHQVH